MLSLTLWRRGLKHLPYGDRCQEVGVRQSRVELRRLLDQARDGGHTIVTKHGDDSAVIVPYDWLRSALPELFNNQTPTSNRNLTQSYEGLLCPERRLRPSRRTPCSRTNRLTLRRLTLNSSATYLAVAPDR